MNSLRQLQTGFRQYLLQPAAQMEKHVVSNEQVDAATRLAIYGDAYRLRLIEALDANYPALHLWIGDDQFNRLALAYIDAHPSRHYSIRWFGHKLSTFMARTMPWNEQLYSLELAQFEWAMSESFDAANSVVVHVDDLARVPPDAWPGLKFRFHPSLRQLPLRSNAPKMWQALTTEKESPDPQQNEHPVMWIVWRNELTIYYRPIEVDETWALNTAINGENFADLCEGLCEWIETAHVAARAAGFLQRWVSDGLIANIQQ